MPAPGCLRGATGATPPHEMLCSEGQEEADATSLMLDGLSLSAPMATAPPATSTGASTAVTSSGQVLEPTATSVGTSIAVVLGNSDLLREILVRLPYPSCLVRSAIVNRFWLSNASDPQFLKRFLKINPTPLLGFYVVTDKLLHPRFVPATHARDPDIANMLILASSQFEVWEDTSVTIWDCRNGKIVVEIGGKLEVRDYLTRPCSIAAYPQSPLKLILNQSFTYQHHEFLPCNGRGHEYYRLAIGHSDGCIIACLSLLCGHIWVNRTSNVTDLPEFATCTDFVVPYGKLGERNLYLVTTCGLIIILDIETMQMHFVEIPSSLVEDCFDLDLCPGLSGIEMYLIGLSEASLSVWSYAASRINEDTWQLLNCIPIQEISRGLFSGDELSLWGVGEQMEFVLFKVDNSIYRLDIEAKKVIKAFQLEPEDDGELERIFPCLMIWPPTFPSSTRSYESAETISPQIVNKMTDQSQGGKRHRTSRSRRRLVTDDTHSQVIGEVSQSQPPPPSSGAEDTATAIVPELPQNQPPPPSNAEATAPFATSVIPQTATTTQREPVRHILHQSISQPDSTATTPSADP